MFAALNTVEPPITDLMIAKFVEAGEEWAEARVSRVVGRIKARLGELSARLGDGDWLDGAFSAGDLLMVAVLRNLASGPILADYPNLAAYVARGEARPAFGRALAALRAGLTGKPPAKWLALAGGEKE